MIRMQIKSLSMLISQVHIDTADDLGSVIAGLDSELTTMLYTLVARSVVCLWCHHHHHHHHHHRHHPHHHHHHHHEYEFKKCIIQMEIREFVLSWL